MAIYGRKEKKIGKDVKTKQAYNEYFKDMRSKNKQPMTFYHWKKGGRRSGYFRSSGGTTTAARLRRSERKKLGMKD